MVNSSLYKKIGSSWKYGEQLFSHPDTILIYAPEILSFKSVYLFALS